MFSQKVSVTRYLITGISLAIMAVIILAGFYNSSAQETKKNMTNEAAAGPVARGKYIVEDVAMCGTCHTPRKADGELDRSRWLAGAPVPYLSAQNQPDWPIVAPRIAGKPPATDEGMITMLTTGVWITGKPLRDPMPKFHMTRADAEAVVAYLRSLGSSQQ